MLRIKMLPLLLQEICMEGKCTSCGWAPSTRWWTPGATKWDHAHQQLRWSPSGRGTPWQDHAQSELGRPHCGYTSETLYTNSREQFATANKWQCNMNTLLCLCGLCLSMFVLYINCMYLRHPISSYIHSIKYGIAFTQFYHLVIVLD